MSRYILNKPKNRSSLAIFLIAAFFLALFVSLTSTPSQNSAALSGSEFKAGRIIDDSVFYTGNAMTAAQIQAFLNSKVPVCDTNGTQPHGGTTRAAYGTSQGYPPPYTCLKDYRQNTPFRAGVSGQCSPLSAKSNRTAAQIIDDVSRACGVSQKVLLVLLQKEQSLVTDDWPWSIQYRSATGYGCPDSAPCASEYYGFFNQVYNAAKAFRRYRENPTSYNYRAGRNNTILWHPNAACGTSNVFIENQATAGLYIYTPYRPNQAALNNLYGTGNSCSSYGNRNFWRMYNDWFGNTHTTSPFAWKYEGQEAFTNSSRTQKFTSSITVRPGEKIYARVQARNWGYNTWGNVFTRIGTSRPIDRKSKFQDDTWLTSTRLAEVTPHAVAPGEIGTFEFVLTAPSTPGAYREYFNLVADGYRWFNDIGLYYDINVVETVAPRLTNNTGLESGESLSDGNHLISPDTNSTLHLDNGELKQKTNFKDFWDSNTSDGTILTMQADGNLVLRNSLAQTLWHTNTSGNPGAYFRLQTDGNLVVRSAGGGAIWSSGTIHYLNLSAYVNDSMLATHRLHTHQSLETHRRSYRLMMQTDGNFVLRNGSGRAIWATRTEGHPGAYASMQSDGNFIIRDASGKAIWYTGTSKGGSKARIRLQKDGNFVLRNGSGRALWLSSTAGM